MSFASRLTRSPDPYDLAAGSEALAGLPAMDPAVAGLIRGTAGCAPYLKGLITKEATWLEGALHDPEASLAALLSGIWDVEAKALPSALRQAKRQVALLTALADLGGVWTLEQVTYALTDFADQATQVALRATVGAEITRGKLPGQGEADIDTAGGMVVLAMGKMGAHELNYSSDVDLICLFDETRFDPDDFFDARASFVRATRRMTAMLSDITRDGYVFRSDLRLRPDPSVTPVCIAMEAAERYYESVGRAWERAAFVKARPCAGDQAAGHRFLESLRPFIWRKHLDFAAIEDAHDMRLRYRGQKGLRGAFNLNGHNVKLGRGGIRDIEFFTQTRQIIAGGRDPDLRVRGTCEGLGVLAAKGWVPEDVAAQLAEIYTAHRDVEHRLQMLRDQQTHSLPKTDDEWTRLACFMGTSVQAVQHTLRERFETVHGLTEGFFAPEVGPARQQDVDDHGFDSTLLARWKTYPALRSERAVHLFERLRPVILAKLAATAHPRDAFTAFDSFLGGLPAGVQVFSLFDANPQLIDLLIDIVGTVPELGKYLARNASVFDAVIAGDFFGSWPGLDALAAQLIDRLAQESDYERKLDAARRWAKEWHFGIGVHHLRGLVDGETAGQRYAALAEACLRALLPEVSAQFSAKHGPPPGRGAVVLGMGSLGAERLNATSDLDLIVVYDPQDIEMSDGKRPLPARTYFARFTQALVTAVSAPMAEGRLYEVDMRLRPSGTQGPVATSWASFATYQLETAWLWEHLAMTRARVVAGPADLAQDIETLRRKVVCRERVPAEALRDLSDMRARIQAAKSGDLWDAKIGPGRLQDIELLAQAALLCSKSMDRSTRNGLDALTELGWATPAQIDVIKDALNLCANLQTISRLLTSQPLQDERLEEQIGQGGLALMLRETDCETVVELRHRLTSLTHSAGEIMSQLITRNSEAG